VLLLDESGEMLVCRYGTGARQRLVGARIRLGHGISGRVAQSGAPHLSPDFQHDPLLAFDPATSARLPEIASDVCVPLRVGEQIVGAMHVSTYASRTFTEAEIRLLTAIADMAANAIRRAGLLEQLERRVYELSVLFDVGKMATATLRIGDVLDFIVGAASRTLHSEGSYVFLWNEREERLVMRAVQGFPPDLTGRVKYRLGEGLSGWAFLEGRTVNVPDVAQDPRWKPEPEHEATFSAGRVTSILIVPLIVGEKNLGVLGVANKAGAPAFTASDQSLLTTLATQIAIAIENARLYEDVRGLSVAAIRSLATAIDARDPYTSGHSEDVAHLAVQLARELGWSGADLEMLEFAALLHDVGKIAVPDAILQKAKPLTPDEWNIIRLHPYHSAQIVKPIEPLQRIVPWVYHHQERWDGTGYPDGLKGEAIPLASRIIAVVDAFNAMTTDPTARRFRLRRRWPRSSTARAGSSTRRWRRHF
jgi:putative nucleotidyltransferase with HDIG domain